MLQAVGGGAAAIVIVDGMLDERVYSTDVPIVSVPDTKEALLLLAAAFYDRPSTKMTTVAITGIILRTSRPFPSMNALSVFVLRS